MSPTPEQLLKSYGSRFPSDAPRALAKYLPLEHSVKPQTRVHLAAASGKQDTFVSVPEHRPASLFGRARQRLNLATAPLATLCALHPLECLHN
jgi:hypothetical protein